MRLCSNEGSRLGFDVGFNEGLSDERSDGRLLCSIEGFDDGTAPGSSDGIKFVLMME